MSDQNGKKGVQKSFFFTLKNLKKTGFCLYLFPTPSCYKTISSNYQGNYEPPEENYEAPVTYGPKPQPEWQKPDQQYSKPPYVAPTNPEPKYHYPSGTKPPVSIRFLFVLYFF